MCFPGEEKWNLTNGSGRACGRKYTYDIWTTVCISGHFSLGWANKMGKFTENFKFWLKLVYFSSEIFLLKKCAQNARKKIEILRIKS